MSSIYALTHEGTVYSWGNNCCGQLGLGDTEERSKPTEVKNLPAIKKLVAYNGTVLTVMKNDEVYVWGKNSQQLQLNAVQPALSPIPIADPEKQNRLCVNLVANGKHLLVEGLYFAQMHGLFTNVAIVQPNDDSPSSQAYNLPTQGK